jgi:RNA-binding protein YhbY
MSQQVDSQTKAFVASAAIPQFARVKVGSDGTISTAVLAEIEIGIAQNAAFAAGDLVNVKLRSSAGTHKAIAAAAIAAGAGVFSAAGGKVSVSATGAYRLGTALEAAAANNDIIEIMYATPGAVV